MARFIPSEEIDNQQVRQWHFGGVRSGVRQGFAVMPEMTADPALLPPQEAVEPVADAVAHEPATDAAPPSEVVSAVPMVSEEELEQRLAQVRQEAFQQGVQHGLAQGLQQGKEQAEQDWQARMQDYQNNEGRETAQRLHTALLAAESQLKGLQQQIAPDLLQLATDIARQVVRQELRCNPQALQPVVAEALDMLGADSKPAVVRLNPEDFQHLEAHLRAALPHPRVEWLPDPSVAAGGCVVESQGAQVDGSLARRWQRAVAALGLVSTWYEGGHEGN